MGIFRIDEDRITSLEPTTFVKCGLKEDDLQKLLKKQIDVISPETLIVAEEFSDWDDSSRRIDLLGIDKAANLVVIELKRTEDGGHMDLQAIRYAAMISTLTFDRLVEIYEQDLSESGVEEDARDGLLGHLQWDDPDESEIGREVKIVLAAAEFSKELTTAVIWLNERGLDIRCVRLRPYINDGQVLLDVQTVIPIPEAVDYQVRVREKKQKERESRRRDYTRYDLSVGGEEYSALPKRRMMYHIVLAVLKNGGTLHQVADVIPRRKLKIFDGIIDAEQVKNDLGSGSRRWFCSADEIVHVNDKTFILSNRWGKDTIDFARTLSDKFPELNCRWQPAPR